MENQINTEGFESPDTNRKRFFTKTKQRILLSVIAVIIGTVSLAGISFAKKIHDLRKEGVISFVIDKVTEGMTLSNDQKSKIAALKIEIKTKVESKKPARKEKFDNLVSEFKKDNLDKAALENMFKKNEQERTEMRDFAESKLIEFHNILTPAQRIQAAEKIEKMREKFQDKMENFQPEK